MAFVPRDHFLLLEIFTSLDFCDTIVIQLSFSLSDDSFSIYFADFSSSGSDHFLSILFFTFFFFFAGGGGGQSHRGIKTNRQG